VTPPAFSRDVLDLLRILSRRDVRYLIVGGEAVIHYGYARLTGDIDLFFDSSSENAERLFEALKEFWEGPVPEIDSGEELLEPGVIFQFGVPPNRIDLMNRIDGVEFAACWDGRLTVPLSAEGANFQAHYIGIGQLIVNKEASGREKDLDDLRFLRQRVKRT
jgi:predicted nucleotidyltransferase